MSDEERNAEGAAYERIVVRWIARCPVTGCSWVGRRNDHESDAYTEIAGHLRRDHRGYVTERTYKHMIVWEPITQTAAQEKTGEAKT